MKVGRGSDGGLSEDGTAEMSEISVMTQRWLRSWRHAAEDTRVGGEARATRDIVPLPAAPDTGDDSRRRIKELKEKKIG